MGAHEAHTRDTIYITERGVRDIYITDTMRDTIRHTRILVQYRDTGHVVHVAEEITTDSVLRQKSFSLRHHLGFPQSYSVLTSVLIFLVACFLSVVIARLL